MNVDLAEIVIRPAEPDDGDEIERLLLSEWFTTRMISRGVVHDLLELPALVARAPTRLAGLVTYAIDDHACEVVTLNALTPRVGLGTRLLDAVAEVAAAAGCERLWLVTSNDNLDALRFYQRRGMRLVALHPGAIDRARELKPAIPMTGHHGIPLRDELELELVLAPANELPTGS